MNNLLTEKKIQKVQNTIIFAIEMTLKGKLTQHAVEKIIEDTFYVNNWVSCDINLMPLDPQFITREYVAQSDAEFKSATKNLPNLYKGCVNIVNDNTTVKLLMSLTPDHSFCSDIYSVLTQELNSCLSRPECLSYLQLDLNEYPVINDIIDHSEIYLEIQKYANTCPNKEWSIQEIKIFISHFLNVELDDEKLLGILWEYFNNTRIMASDCVLLSDHDMYKTVEVSTGVLTERDQEVFNLEMKNRFSLVASRHVGYFVKVPMSGLEIRHGSLFSKLSKPVQSIFKQAHASNIQCVEFDCDV